jgi:hypothetical protein
MRRQWRLNNGSSEDGRLYLEGVLRCGDGGGWETAMAVAAEMCLYVFLGEICRSRRRQRATAAVA